MGNVARTPRLSETPLLSSVWAHPGVGGDASVTRDRTANTLGVVFGGVKATATLSAWWDDANARWERVSVAVDPNVASIDVERINRLLSGLDAPRLETYWRTKALTIKAHGRRIPAPFGLSGRLVGSSTTVWSWTAARGGAVPTPIPTKPVPPVTRASTAAGPVTSTAGYATKPAATLTGAAVKEALADLGLPPEPAPEPEPVAPPPPVAIKVPALPAGGTFRTPKALPFKVHLDAGVEAGLERSLRIHLSMKPRTYTVAALRGPTGTGKTLAAEHLAAKHGLPYAKFDAAGMVTFADWVGAVSLDTGEQGVVTKYAPSAFIEAVRADGPYAGVPRIVLIDEVTRIVGTSAANALLPMLDGTGTVYVPDARVHINIDRAVFFIVTANIGSQYAGTVALDSALTNRIKSWLRVPYPSAETEASIVAEQSGCTKAQAAALVRVAVQTRSLAANRTIDSVPVSTRQLVAAGLHIAFGATPLEAAMVAFVDSYDDEGGAQSERAHVLQATEAVLRGG